MSITNQVNTRNASFSDYDYSKFLLGNNEFAKATYTDSGSGSTLDAHVVVAKVTATGALVEWASGASDGSQFPVGLLWLGGAASVDVAASASIEAEYVNKGRIDKNLIAFPGAETLATAVSGHGRLEDWLEGLGLVLEDGVELTAVDNS